MSIIRPVFKTQLFKWVGNKQRMSNEILTYFPSEFNTYFEPFLGSGAVLGTLRPEKAVASDVLPPLIEIWQLVKDDPQQIIEKYAYWRDQIDAEGENKKEIYERAREEFNTTHDAGAFMFISRACYGGIIRFRKADHGMSTPCGAHMPISSSSFASRVKTWHKQIAGAEFICADFREIIPKAGKGDMIYCDPPYVDSQKILYGAQAFDLKDLFREIAAAKERGAYIALSIDGTKRSGLKEILLNFPEGLFETEVDILVGRSMLRRFQREGDTLESEVVRDRLMLTYIPDDLPSDQVEDEFLAHRSVEQMDLFSTISR